MRTYKVHISFEFDGRDGIRVEILTENKEVWMSFHVSPLSLGRTVRTLSFYEPFIKRLKRALRLVKKKEEE